MLKLLLGHWKAHRRKPSLLPEAGEIHSEDPSRINPIYEDSEGSITSSQRDPDSLDLDADLRSNSENRTNIDLHLVDISIPENSNVDNPNYTEEENPDDIINQIDIAVDSSFQNETLEPTDQTNNALEPKVKSTDELTSKISDEIETKVKSSTSTVHSAESVNKKVTQSETSEIVSNEISHKSIDPIQVERIFSSKPEQPIRKEDSKKEVLTDMTPRTQESAEKSAIPSTSTGLKNEDKKQVKGVISSAENLVLEPKMETSVKTRAIDELIKKFQGQNFENGAAIQTISSFLHSPNRKPITKAITSEKKKNDSEIATSNNGREKESLSKIFSFPPPPPMEPFKSNKQIEKDSFVETKTSISKSPSNADSFVTQKEGKTRSDSSLSRNKTVSSNNNSQTSKTESNQAESQIKNDSIVKDVTSNYHLKKVRSEPSNTLPSPDTIHKIENKIVKKAPQTSSKTDNTSSLINRTDSGSKPLEQNYLKAKEGTSFVSKEGTTTLSNSSKQKTEKPVSNQTKQSLAKSSPSPELTKDSTASKTLSEVASPKEETDVIKSHSEDSGITRGDQISSEASPETPHTEPPEEEKIAPPNLTKRNVKDRRNVQNRGKKCKRCRKSHGEGAPLKRGECDDYYDVLTGIRRPHRSKHSDSWASDLSWEEKELIRRLRSRRESVRSKAKSTKGRHRNLHDGYFQRHQPIRRSLSEDSTFNGSSACSCDQCYMILIKDYAYDRASLRGIPQHQVLCTCRTARPDFLGRRVKFRADPILETATSEKTLTTHPIPEESSKKEDGTDTRSTSNLSTESHESGLRDGKLSDKKEKKNKSLKESYRIVTPWELEEWDLARKRNLLQKRRKRARYMAFMALAMVIFVGLVVAVLMVYLRRKVL